MRTLVCVHVLMTFVVATGCGSAWVTASAAGMPNPVLLGPVQCVQGASVAEGPRHSLGPEIFVRMWEESRSSAFWGDSSSTSKWTTSRPPTALEFELFEALVPWSIESWQEPYRSPDVVRVEHMRLL